MQRGRKARTAGARPERPSVLRDVRVDPESSVPPGRQLEGHLAVMIREGRLEPGRRLPSTRRLAPAVGLHRNTVAAAYRRLVDRELLEMRHGARARVPPAADGAVGGAMAGTVAAVLAAAEDLGTARLLAAELRAALPSGVPVEAVASGGAPGSDRGGRRLVAALPGPGLRRVPPEASLRLRQDRREAVRAALRRAPPLAVVAVATESAVLRDAVLSDAARLPRPDLSLVPPSGRRVGRRGATAGSAASPDLVIADRLAADAFCGRSAPPSAVVRARLVCRDSLAAAGREAGGPGA